VTTISITKDEKGHIVGVGEKGKKAYAAFKKRVEGLQPGEIYTIEAWFDRNPKLHGLHFILLETVFDNQEQFADPEQLRAWLQVGAGHCKFVPGPTGRMVAIPESIAWHRMDDQDFAAHHEKVKDFLRTEHAKAFLWPHLPESERDAMIDTILSQFEKGE